MRRNRTYARESSFSSEPDFDEDEGVEVRHFGILRETEKALLFQIEPGLLGRRQWVPKSVIVEEFDRSVVLATWFAEKENLG
jgi:hypothetical protein